MKWSGPVESDSLWPHGLQPARLLCPWDFPGKNTGVGCHFLLQCMKVKSKSEVMSESVRPHGKQPTRLLCPWGFPGKSTGVGCQRQAKEHNYVTRDSLWKHSNLICSPTLYILTTFIGYTSLDSLLFIACIKKQNITMVKSKVSVRFSVRSLHFCPLLCPSLHEIFPW